MTLASFGCSSNQAISWSPMMLSTTGFTSEETSLSFVWLENFGSGTFTDSTQVRPSRASSPERSTFSFLAMPLSPAYLLMMRVSAARKPARCVPPSRCGMLLVNSSTFSW